MVSIANYGILQTWEAQDDMSPLRFAMMAARACQGEASQAMRYVLIKQAYWGASIRELLVYIRGWLEITHYFLTEYLQTCSRAFEVGSGPKSLTWVAPRKTQ